MGHQDSDDIKVASIAQTQLLPSPKGKKSGKAATNKKSPLQKLFSISPRINIQQEKSNIKNRPSDAP